MVVGGDLVLLEVVAFATEVTEVVVAIAKEGVGGLCFE